MWKDGVWRKESSVLSVKMTVDGKSWRSSGCRACFRVGRSRASKIPAHGQPASDQTPRSEFRGRIASNTAWNRVEYTWLSHPFDPRTTTPIDTQKDKIRSPLCPCDYAPSDPLAASSAGTLKCWNRSQNKSGRTLTKSQWSLIPSGLKLVAHRWHHLFFSQE